MNFDFILSVRPLPYQKALPRQCKKNPAGSSVRQPGFEIEDQAFRSTLVLQNFSSTGISRTQITAAVKPPLYRQ